VIANDYLRLDPQELVRAVENCGPPSVGGTLRSLFRIDSRVGSATLRLEGVLIAKSQVALAILASVGMTLAARARLRLRASHMETELVIAVLASASHHFTTDCLAAPAGKAFTIYFDNQDTSWHGNHTTVRPLDAKSRATQGAYPLTQGRWLPMEYRSFYDIPRMVAVTLGKTTYFFIARSMRVWMTTRPILTCISCPPSSREACASPRGINFQKLAGGSGGCPSKWSSSTRPAERG
jgi:hypothetical protein